MAGPVLIQQHRYIDRRRLTAQSLQGREAHHHGRHLIFVHQDYLVRQLLVVADAAVCLEQIVQKLRHVRHNQVELGMGDTKLRTAQPLGVPIHHHGRGQIVGHPAIAEKGFDVPGLHDEF